MKEYRLFKRIKWSHSLIRVIPPLAIIPFFDILASKQYDICTPISRVISFVDLSIFIPFRLRVRAKISSQNWRPDLG